MTDLATDAQPESAAEVIRRRAAYHSCVRFHLILDLSLAAVASIVLKIDGPWYADAISAGLFLIGFMVSVHSLRAVSQAEKEYGAVSPLPPSPRPIFVLLAGFFVASAFAVIWFTYVAPPSGSTSEDSGLASSARRPPAPEPLPSPRPLPA